MHWYDFDGKPQYEILGKNGKLRPTTLRDAREHRFVPSVTTIIDVMAKPALTNWLVTTAVAHTINSPKRSDETIDDWAKRIAAEAREESFKTADAGTAIHASVEAMLIGEDESIDPNHHPHVQAVLTTLRDAYGDSKWISEKSFCHHSGFGGKVDLHCKGTHEFPEGIVIDIKTKDFGPDDDVKGWPNHVWQLAAYRKGLDMPDAQCGNLFVSRSHPGVAKLVTWSQLDLERAWKAFDLMIDLWKIINNYDPTEGL